MLSDSDSITCANDRSNDEVVAMGWLVVNLLINPLSSPLITFCSVQKAERISVSRRMIAWNWPKRMVLISLAFAPWTPSDRAQGASGGRVLPKQRYERPLGLAVDGAGINGLQSDFTDSDLRWLAAACLQP